VIKARTASPDHSYEVRRFSVLAAALVLALIAAGCGAGGGRAAVAHSCGATDKSFIQTASINMTALGLWTSGYQSGEIEASEVVEQAYDAAKRVGYVRPNDPSLREAQKLLDAMFREYGDAVKLKDKGKDVGKRMYRAYGLANFARDVLVEAQPELYKQGCNVQALL
jgi:hypothetical protein